MAAARTNPNGLKQTKTQTETTIAQVFVPELLKQLATSELPDERAGAAETLGAMGAAAAEFAPHLARALHDDDWPVRCAALAALRNFGTKAVVPHLDAAAALLHDDAPEVRSFVRSLID